MKLVTRAQWGARSRSIPTNITPTGGVTIHYVGGPVRISSHSACDNRVRSIQDHHVDGNGWADIAYSALVCPHGYVFVGRGPNRRTAANGTNPGNQYWYAVCALIGGSQKPTDDMVQGIKDAVAWLRRSGGAGRRVNGHRDHLSTSCPGAPLYRMVQAGAFGSGGDSTGEGGGSGPYESYRKGAKPGSRTIGLYDAGDDVKVAQRKADAEDDGWFGPKTEDQVRAYQRKHDLAVDGLVGPETWGHILDRRGGKPPAPSKPGTRAPDWPGVYLTQPPVRRTSECGTWQRRMRERGWSIEVDRWYGPKSEHVCRQFQDEKGLKVDGVVGPKTWRATWEAPIT